MARSNLSVPAGLVPLNASEKDIIVKEVATAQTNAIYPGEPVQLVNDGTVIRTPAGTSTSAVVDGSYGVCVEIIRYKDVAGFVRRNAKFLPAATAWTAAQESSLIAIIPTNSNVRYRVRGTTSGLTLAQAKSLSGENCDHLFGTADTGLGLTGCALNIATHAVTAVLQWRVVEIVDVSQNDPTQVNFILDVVPNLIQGWPIVGGAALGV